MKTNRRSMIEINERYIYPGFFPSLLFMRVKLSPRP